MRHLKNIVSFLNYIILSIRFYFKINLTYINITIFLLMLIITFIIILIKKFSFDIFQINNNNIDYYKDVFDIIFQFITTLIIILGLIFSYYKFIRGRIFKPKIDIEVRGNAILQDENKIAILRCTIRNIGNVAISPLSLEGKFYFLDVQNSTLKYVCFEKRNNLLEEYFFEDSQKFYLEPNDKMEIDIDIILDQINKINRTKIKNLSNILIRINLILKDRKLYKWSSNTILLINKDMFNQQIK